MEGLKPTKIASKRVVMDQNVVEHQKINVEGHPVILSQLLTFIVFIRLILTFRCPKYVTDMVMMIVFFQLLLLTFFWCMFVLQNLSNDVALFHVIFRWNSNWNYIVWYVDQCQQLKHKAQLHRSGRVHCPWVGSW